MRLPRPLRLAIPLVAGTLIVAACGSSDDGGSAGTVETGTPGDSTTGTVAGGGVDPALATEVATSYADGVYASYDASLTSATAMQEAIEAFLADPTDATLQAAKDAWLTARDDYGPTEAFRFYDGPIDNPEDGPEGRINAWPMDEAYVDYVEDDETAGIINDTAGFPEITTDVIVAANEEGGETNISTGWHAVEFLLWGQDLSDDGPGARPVTDYTTAANADRRATYLELVTQQLIDDLTSVRDQWAPEGGAYRAEFLADPSSAVSNMVRGIGALNTGELAGERMTVAYETKDREDEHSCFSDNTNADVVNNIKGVRMVYLGELPGGSGTGLSALVAASDPELDTTLREQLDATLAQAEAFPGTFEAMIAADDGSPERTAMLDVITALEQQGTTLAEAAQALGVQVNFEV
jgi:putative iron-regulated protein